MQSQIFAHIKTTDTRFGGPFHLKLSGRILPKIETCKNFDISFYEGGQTKQIAFRISIRPNESFIKRNSTVNGAFASTDEEECFIGLFPFARGVHYEMKISSIEDQICVYVNEKFICNFKYRFNPKKVNTVEIEGPTVIDSMKVEYL